MNKMEAALLREAEHVVDYRCMSPFQKLCSHVSWHGFLVGTVWAVVVACLAEIVSRVQSAPINAGTIFIVGIFGATVYLNKFSSFLVTVDGIISYYVLFSQWISGRWGSWSFNLGLLVFALLAFGVYSWVRFGMNRRPNKDQAMVRAIFTAAVPEQMQDRVPFSTRC